MQLIPLAEAVPEDLYGWRPVAGTRSFSAVLVHIAAGNLLLLRSARMSAPEAVQLYGALNGDPIAQLVFMIRKNVSLEATLTRKQDVTALLQRSLAAVRSSFTEASDDELNRIGTFFGEQTTVRRMFLRMLAHTQEHMGQAIAYVRGMGLQVPWPDPLSALDAAENAARA